MTLIRLVARPMLASTFVYGGINALRNASALAEAAKPVNDEIRGLAGKVAPQVPIPENDATLVRINAGVHIAAGLALATGRVPRVVGPHAGLLGALGRVPPSHLVPGAGRRNDPRANRLPDTCTRSRSEKC